MELFTSTALDQGGWVWLGLGWSGTYRGETELYVLRWDILGLLLDLTWQASLLRLPESHLKLDSSTELGAKLNFQGSGKRKVFVPTN